MKRKFEYQVVVFGGSKIDSNWRDVLYVRFKTCVYSFCQSFIIQLYNCLFSTTDQK